MSVASLMILVFAGAGVGRLAQAWWAYTGRPASAERFGQITAHLFAAGLLFAAATISSVVMLVTRFDPLAINRANMVGIGLMIVTFLLEARVNKLGERWYARRRLTSPDFEEDAEGNPARPPDAAS